MMIRTATAVVESQDLTGHTPSIVSKPLAHGHDAVFSPSL